MVTGWLALLLLRLVCETPLERCATVEKSADAPKSDPAARQVDRLVALGCYIERRLPFRAEWIDMLAAVLKGEGFDEGKGWWHPSERIYGWTWLKDRYDLNGDGRVEADGLRVGLRAIGASLDDLDRDLSGDITESDLLHSRGRPVSVLTDAVFRQIDEDSNDRVSWAELSWFFQRADRGKRGSITRQDLETLLGAAIRDKPHEEEKPPRERALALFLSGNLGSIRSGPSLGSMAPDFELPSRTGGASFRLSSSYSKKPVVLIFGSFT